MSTPSNRERLVAKLKSKSVFRGEFTLASGAKSDFYLDCRLTTLDPEGATLVGEEMFALIRDEARKLGVKVEAIGGLTMGADPISLATGLVSWREQPEAAYQVYVVRKEPKGHGKGKQVEGNFVEGMSVVVVEDVVTRGDSTLKAITAVEAAGGKVAFVAVLVDREEGGCDKIRGQGYHVATLVKRTEIIE